MSFVLANFEFFSSTFKEFRVSISNRYPSSPTSNDNKNDNGWHLLGEFKAKNSREMQLFEVRDPVIWARYLRIDFLTHYGNQVYCPVSLLRVHGTTMIEEYKNREENNRMLSDESFVGDFDTNNDVNGNNHNTVINGDGIDGSGSNFLNNNDDIMNNNMIDRLRRYSFSGENNNGNNKDTNQDNLDIPGDDNMVDTDLFGYYPWEISGTCPIPHTFEYKFTLAPHYKKIQQNKPKNQKPEQQHHESQLDRIMNICLIDQSPRIPSPLYDEEITDSTSKNENSSSSNNQTSSNSTKPTTTTTITTATAKTTNNTSPPSYIGSGTLSIYQKIQNKISNLEANATFFRRYLEEQSNLLENIWKRYQESETKWQQMIWGLNQTVEMLTKAQEQTRDAIKRIENDVRHNNQHINILKSDLHRLYIQLMVIEAFVLLMMLALCFGGAHVYRALKHIEYVKWQ
ncbi:7049_t:CDS:2 [Ambispora gerdemannii]|uniref:7049_t:CDS:1 n=1 Tax=Ambispora gerdemannii TaxID=144530 RepID=A0A9N9F5Y8_9GLOM|nr:7049_t:CDS:2 [Ambispora gerdemannii]